MASVGNVKKYDSSSSLWKDESGNKNDGSSYMMRKVQRQPIVKAMQSPLNSNDDVNNESNRFNLIAAPGYPELLDEMISVSTSRKDTVFAVADSLLKIGPTQQVLAKLGN